MTDKIFTEIDKFDKWAQSQFDEPQDEVAGEWECNYENWNEIYLAFEKLMTHTHPNDLTDKQKDRLLYIIARDNETEYLSSILNDDFLLLLTEHSIIDGKKNDKWQLAIQLYRLVDRQKALQLLENFVDDDDEYVNRRALMELARVNSDKVEFYAQKFWNKNKYGEMEEYQKMAVLQSLSLINSKIIDSYINLALQSGQKNLTEFAKKLKSERNNY